MKSNQSQFKSLKYAAIALFAISSTNVIADQEFSTLDGIPAQVMSHQDLSKVEGKNYVWTGYSWIYFPAYYPQYHNPQNVSGYNSSNINSLLSQFNMYLPF